MLSYSSARNETPLFDRLQQRGDTVAVENGRIIILPASGKPVPRDWIKNNRLDLMREIAILIECPAFLYRTFSKGYYGQQKASGITLQFDDLRSGEGAYTVFNAQLTRLKTDRHGKSGQLLPGKQFRVGRKSGFVSFWNRTGLALPPRLGSFHDYLGNLKPIIFTGVIDQGGRINSSSLVPMSVPAGEISSLINEKYIASHTVSRPPADTSHTIYPDENSLQTQQLQGFRERSTACANRCETSKQESRVVFPYYTNKPTEMEIESRQPERQSTDEWLQDYGEH